MVTRFKGAQVIASELEGLRGLVHDGQTGLLVANIVRDDMIGGPALEGMGQIRRRMGLDLAMVCGNPWCSASMKYDPTPSSDRCEARK